MDCFFYYKEGGTDGDYMTPKQKIFCEEYVKDFNATRAYKAAYPTVKKDGSASAAGTRLLGNVNIKKYIDELKRKQQSESDIKRIELLNELKEIGFARVEKIDAKDKIKALELLAKMLGYDTPADKQNNGMLAELIEGLKAL